MAATDDGDDERRYQAPYSARRPIPTISRYREERAARQLERCAATTEALTTLLPGPGACHGAQLGTAAAATTATNPRGLPADTSQADRAATDPRQRRRQLRLRRRERAERLVTDPVTHLPVTIHDFTGDALDELDLDGRPKPAGRLEGERPSPRRPGAAPASRFPPPELDALRRQLAAIGRRGRAIGLAGTAAMVAAALALGRGTGWLALVALSAAAVAALVAGVCDYTTRAMDGALLEQLWDAPRRRAEAADGPGAADGSDAADDSESAAWLNSLLAAAWPLVNPDLLVSLADTLEDVMQASLPRLVRMVSVDDMGQGSEAVRILGVRWLPAAAAGPGDDDDDDGDCVNMEVAFAYRARARARSLKDRSNNMHLYLGFYLPANVRIPVWVDLLAMAGVVRLRLQLTSDPPFVARCTLTLLGQPRVDLSCTPLSQRGLNVMDVPLISSFVQAAVDAAVAAYVAPRSLTLDLRDMLGGHDCAHDTGAVGVVVVRIRRGYDFRPGDAAIPLLRDGSSDPYVSVGWAKFAKVLWSTRVLRCEMEPSWDETCFLLVTPHELDIAECLRVQLWDSDRFTADDDLGRIEVPLRDLMADARARARMWERVDGFRALAAAASLPGKLEWSVGYFDKAAVQPCQLARQTHDPGVRSMAQLRAKVARVCERKLRETALRTARDDVQRARRRALELQAEHDAIVNSAPPPDHLPSGLLRLQIHNIVGLELQRPSRRQAEAEAADEASDEEETGERLPSSYCTVILNHSKTFRTRVKPQNAKPFFNAGCERFVRDWRDCEVFVSVRDARLHEDNPLLGIVHLPLAHVFRHRSQLMAFWPLSGGIGYGRIRLSLVWRSVCLQAPRALLGWSYGTVEVQPLATSPDCPPDLRPSKLKLKTNISMGKLYPLQDAAGEAQWRAKKGQNLSLAVARRYSSCLSIAFSDKRGLFKEKVAAFCVLWLKDIADDDECDLELPIWKGDFDRATACCLDECGDRLGTLRLRLTFWAGLGTAHSRWASRNQNLRDVVEVIETARDILDAGRAHREAGVAGDGADADEAASSDSDSSDGSGSVPASVPDSSADRQGPLDRIRDYRRRDKALHRQHRGIMQWKIPRTARWMKHKWERVGDGVTGLFDHHEKQAGIETEL